MNKRRTDGTDGWMEAEAEPANEVCQGKHKGSGRTGRQSGKQAGNRCHHNQRCHHDESVPHCTGIAFFAFLD